MRISRAVVALAAGLLVLTIGCSRDVTGVAKPDPRQPPVELSEDGFGITAGFADAPTKVELFTEPQCIHCAELQADFGDEMAGYLKTGQLAVTYRPLTFLDDEDEGYSARVSRALFLTADPKSSAIAFQAFVQEIYAQQNVFIDGFTDDQMADMARDAGLPSEVVDRIADGESDLDVVDMADANFEYLFGVSPLEAGTPTVYDPETEEIIDIYDNNWLSKLISSV